MMHENPCLTCGACCAYFRISFYWSEADVNCGGSIPEDLTEDVTGFISCMRGTNQVHPRCVALEGEIGKRVFCSIYNRRSNPCRDFGVHWRYGGLRVYPEDLERCNRARKVWGLPPLPVPGPGLWRSINSFRKMHPALQHNWRRITRRGPRGGMRGTA